MGNIVNNAARYDWQTWAVGILRSFVSGGAGAIAGMLGPMVTDGKDFNLTTAGGFHHLMISMGIGFLLSGLVHLAMFLQTHSAPEKVGEAQP